MTPEQMAVMIRVFQFGFSVGMTNRFEMIRKYCELYPVEMFAVLPAALEFERGCGISHEQAEDLRKMTVLEFTRWLLPEKCE